MILGLVGWDDLRALKAGQTERTLVERQSAGATRSGTKRRNDGIGKRALPRLERDHGGKHLLLILDDEHVNLQRPLDRGGRLLDREAVDAGKDPDGLDHRHNAA